MSTTFKTILISVLISVFVAFFIIQYRIPQSKDLSVTVSQKTAYDRVIESGKIRCGWGTWDPYIYYDFDKEKPVGVIVDLMEAMAQNLNLELVWGEETGWANIPTALNNGRIDVACTSLWNDPSRGRLVAFTDPAFYMVSHVFVRAGEASKYKSLEDLNRSDLRISVQDGGSTYELAQRLFPKAKLAPLSQTNQSNELFVQVVTGKADVMISDQLAVDRFNENNDKKLERIKLLKPVNVFGNSYAVGINEHALKEVLNTTVAYMTQTGEFEELTKEFREKYPGNIYFPKFDLVGE